MGEENQRGAELDAKYGRTDGVNLAFSLKDGLEGDLRAWFYDRVFCLLRSIPESNWSRTEQMRCEFVARNEISVFQSIVSATVVRDREFVAHDWRWFAEWALKLNLGEQAGNEAAEGRLSFYWDSDRREREEKLCFALGYCLPDKQRVGAWVQLLAPLLTSMTKATMARSINIATLLLTDSDISATNRPP